MPDSIRLLVQELLLNKPFKSPYHPCSTALLYAGALSVFFNFKQYVS